MVAVELSALQADGWADRGVGRFAASFASALDRTGVVAAGLLDPDRPPPFGLPPGLLFSGRLAWNSAATCRRLAQPGLWYQITAPFLGFEQDEDHLAPGPWERSGAARAAVLYDLIPLRAPTHYLPAPELEARYRRRAAWIASSDLLLAISDHTRREAIELIGCEPDRVVTVGVGVSEYFCPPDGTDEGRWKAFEPVVGERPFLITVTGSDVRKGGDRAIVALARLIERGYDLSLVVAGHLDERWISILKEAAVTSGVVDRVHLVGAVDDELLRALYRRAELNLMPSLAEGFGLPVLESAACGTPAVASNRTALAEAAGHDLARFDPTDVDSIADSVAAAIDSPGRGAAILAVQQEIAGASTWDRVAARTVTALEGLSDGRPVSPPPPRLALVGASASGAVVGDKMLGEGAEVHRFADAEGINLSAYDTVVYLIADGDDGVRRAASSHAGWLWPERPDVALEPLIRVSRGVLVRTATDWHQVRLRLARLAATPPVVVIDSPGGVVDRLTGAPGGAAGTTADPYGPIGAVRPR